MDKETKDILYTVYVGTKQYSKQRRCQADGIDGQDKRAMLTLVNARKCEQWGMTSPWTVRELAAWGV